MSTRCQIKITDGDQELWFYRHSDGYPRTTLPSLRTFLKWVTDGKIRDNVEQSSGWLVLLGAKEYGKKYVVKKESYVEKTMDELFEPRGEKEDAWKCGAYEPCPCERHGDIAWFYTIDLARKTIKVENVSTGRTAVAGPNQDPQKIQDTLSD